MVLATRILKFGFVFRVASLWWLMWLSKLEKWFAVILLTCYWRIPLFPKPGFRYVFKVEYKRERESCRLFLLIIIVFILYLQVIFEGYPLVFISRNPSFAWIISCVIYIVKMALGASSPPDLVPWENVFESPHLIPVKIWDPGLAIICCPSLFFFFSVFCFTHVNSCGHFLLKMMIFTVQQQATFSGVIGLWNRKPVGAPFYPPQKLLLQSRGITAPWPWPRTLQ